MAATKFISDPVIVSSNRFHDIGNYVKKLFANDSLRWGSIWPWEFPQKGTKDEEENFLRECFGDREIHMQGGAGKHGDGFRFLKQAWYSAALYNFETRVPLTVQWWFDTNQELVRDPTMAEYFFKPDVELSTFFLNPQIKLFGAKFLKVVVNEIQKKLITVLEAKEEPAPLAVENLAPLKLSSPSECVQPEEQIQSGENPNIREDAATLGEAEVKYPASESEQPSSPQGLGLTTDVVEISEQPVSPKTNSHLSSGTENRPPTSAVVHPPPPRLTTIDGNAQVFPAPRQASGYAPNPRPSMPFQGHGNENYHNKKNEHARRQSDHGRRNTSWSGYRQDSSTYPSSTSVRPATDMTTSWSPSQPFYHEQPPHSHFAHQSSTNNRQNPSFGRERRGSKHIMDPASFSRDLPAPPASSNASFRHNRGNDHRQFSHHNPNMMQWAKNENVHPRYWTSASHGAGGYKNTPHMGPQHYADYNQYPSPAQYPGHQSRPPFEGFHPLSHEKPWASRSLNAEQRGGPNMPFNQQQAYVSEVLPPPDLVPYMPMPLLPPHYPSHDKIGERNRPATDVTLREEPKYVPPHRKPNVNLQKSRGPCGNGCGIHHIDEACGSATQLVAQKVPSTVTGELLHHMFSQYGTVHHIYRSCGAAFVDYEMPASASICLAKQADLKLHINNIFVEVSRMHCDPRFLFSSHEARTNFLRSDHQHYDYLAKWLAENRATLRNFDQPKNALPQSVPRGEPARNRPEAVEDSTQPKKPKKGTHKKKPEGRTEAVAKHLHDPPPSPELSRKNELATSTDSKSSKKKSQQHPRRRAEQIESTEPKTSPDHTVIDRAMSEPPQPTRKSRVRERSLPEVLVEESEPVALPVEDFGEPIELQAAPTVEMTVDVTSSVPAASPLRSGIRKPSAATSDIDESINISEPKTPEAGQAIELPTSEDLMPDLHSDKPNVTTPALQKSDAAQIATHNYAEVARVKVEDEPEVTTKVSTLEPDSKAPDELEITTKTQTPVQDIAPSSPAVDRTTEVTKVDILDGSLPVAKKAASAVETARIVSSKKENKPKGPPATESLSQFGRKNEKKSKVPRGKGSLKGRLKLVTLDDAITSAISSKPPGMDAQAEKSSDTNGSKDLPASTASPVDAGSGQSQQVAKKNEAQRNDVSKDGVVKSTTSWLPNLTGFLSKTRQLPKVSPAAVDPPEKVIAEQKIASPKHEESQPPPQAESASDDQMPPSPKIKIIITRSSSPEEPSETQEVDNMPEVDDQPAPPSHIESTDTVTQNHDTSLLQANLAECADSAGEPKAQKLNSDVAVRPADHVGTELWTSDRNMLTRR
jgi:hypothetical protein